MLFVGALTRSSNELSWPSSAAGTDADLDPSDEPRDALDAELRAIALRTAGIDHTVEAPAARIRAGRSTILRRALLIADIVGCAAALAFVALFVVNNLELHDLATFALLVPAMGAWALASNVYGFYESERIGVGRSTADDLPALILLSSLMAWLGVLTLNAIGLAHPRLRVAAAFWILAILFMIATRTIARTVARGLTGYCEPTLIIGAGRVGARIASKLTSRPEYGLKLVGFLDDDPLESATDGVAPFLGGTSRLEHVIRAHRVERVIVAFSRASGDELVELSRRCTDLGVQVDIVPRMYEVIGSRNTVHFLDGLPLLGLRPPRLSRSARFMKGTLDTVVAAASLFVLSPFFLYAAIRIKLGSPGPVFFRQERMGAGGKRFQILKFRTMVADADQRKHEVEHLNKHTEDGAKMFKIADDPRITKFGSFLRAWSLDELPQLINVLRREMSLVGPRPLILDEDENIVGARRRRLDQIPGITGLWQVLGRSDIPFSEMVTLDYLYVTNWSLWGDIKLLARTVPIVVKKRGAY
jgi:exopolysaccharide biosynthesis polyprenyl glycosylphosphotransferase